MPGDIVSHGASEAVYNQSFEIFSQGLPNRHMRVFPAVGNNDIYPDYVIDMNTSKQLIVLDELLDHANITTWMSKEQRETFRKGGYYDVRVAQNVTLVTLNTIIYTTEYLTANNLTREELGDDPFGQLDYLKNVVAEQSSE